MSSTCLISNCSKPFQGRFKDMTGTVSPLNMNDPWGRGRRCWHRKGRGWDPPFHILESVCLPKNFPGPPEDTHQQLLSTEEPRNNGPSLCVHHPDTISATSVEHDYWKQNSTDRISHPSFRYGSNKDARTQTTPLAVPPPSWPPASASSMLFCFQLLIGRHLICTAISFSEHTGHLRPTDTCGKVAAMFLAPVARSCPPPLPRCSSHCVPPYSVSVAAEKKSK